MQVFDERLLIGGTGRQDGKSKRFEFHGSGGVPGWLCFDMS
jgi:hypothetical protein